jgi:hypothetical protein
MVSEKAIFPFMECRIRYTGGGFRKDFEKHEGITEKICGSQHHLMPLN